MDITTNPRYRATAIIPSYNEGKRILNALEAVTKAKLVEQVIVIDDGSKNDDTERVVKNFPGVFFLKNETNKGKAYAMNRGVQESKSPIIFFCDADLENITPEIIDAIIRPVAEKQYDMFIGVRNNVAQKIFLPFAINSGERALRREFWEYLPDFYKYRFRIEVGLNLFVRKRGEKGYSHKVFPYYQTAKERKWGFWKGTKQRWRMNYDVALGWIKAMFFEDFKKIRIK